MEMADKIVAFNTPDAIHLRCAVCKGHLSSAPVFKSETNGSFYCGRCTPPIWAAPVFPVTILKNMLKGIKYTCCFRGEGCPIALSYTEKDNHEIKCEYGFKLCPASAACSSEIVTSDLYPHFTDYHPELVKETPEFVLEIGQNSREVFVFITRGVAFIVQYRYNGKDNCLRYDVRAALGTSYEGSCTPYLSDCLDLGCGVILPSAPCAAFGADFHAMENVKSVDLGKYLSLIKDPKDVRISLNIAHRPNGAVGMFTLS